MNLKNIGIRENAPNKMNSQKALLFINGTPPEILPDVKKYTVVGCTDGAFSYLLNQKFDVKELTFVSGDFDDEILKKQVISESENARFQVIETPDQNKTDFAKALEILLEKGIQKVDVFGGSGGEMDHFLGNLTVAFTFKNQLEITFYDDYSTYFFIPKTFEISDVKGKMISLYPFPSAEKIITKGLNWSLTNENLSMTSRIGTRNFASEDSVSVTFEQGEMLIFIER